MNCGKIGFARAALACAFVLVAFNAGAAIPDANPAAVVASQGGAKVTVADVDAFAEKIPAERRANFFDNPQRIATLLNNLLLQKQLAALARSEGLDKVPQPDGKPWSEDRLAAAETGHFRETLQVPPMDELAKEEFIANPQKYMPAAKFDVEQVLVSTKAHSEADARKIADEVEVQARKNPTQFEALVEKYSDDPGKENNHGLVTHADTHPSAPFAAAAKALEKPGDISPIVQTEFGFHVLKLLVREPAPKATFDEVRPRVIEALKRDYIKRMMASHIDTLRNNPIDANRDLVASLRTRYRATPVPVSPGPKEKPKKS